MTLKKLMKCASLALLIIATEKLCKICQKHVQNLRISCKLSVNNPAEKLSGISGKSVEEWRKSLTFQNSLFPV